MNEESDAPSGDDAVYLNESLRILRESAQAALAETGPLLEAARELLDGAGARRTAPGTTASAAPETGGSMPGHEHGGAESTCRSCPICRTLDAVRTVRPEVLGHLRLALDHVSAALSVAVNTEPSSAPAGEPGGSPAAESVTMHQRGTQPASDDRFAADDHFAGPETARSNAPWPGPRAVWPPTARVWGSEPDGAAADTAAQAPRRAESFAPLVERIEIE